MSDLSDAAVNRAGDERLLNGEHSADPVARFLEGVTRPLRMDPEVQLEVRQELATHVTDTRAALIAAGRAESDATEEALRALGDPAELSQQLYQANRRRMRMRTMLTWAARLVLPPVTIALVIVLGASAVTAWALQSSWFQTSQFAVMDLPVAKWIQERYQASVMAGAPQDVKPLLQQQEIRGREAVQIARELVERDPQDRALYANLALEMLQWTSLSSVKFGGKIDSLVSVGNKSTWDETLAVLEEGERREPGNAFYPLVISGLLFEQSASEIQEQLGPGDQVSKNCDVWGSLKVTRPERFARAMEAAQRAAHKPYYRSYEAELIRRKLDALPARQVADIWMRGLAEEERMIVTNPLRQSIQSMAYRATDLARAGKKAEAFAVMRDMRSIGGLLGEDAHSRLDFSIAAAYVIEAQEAEFHAYNRLGDRALAQEALRKFQRERTQLTGIYASPLTDDQVKQSGMFFGVFSGGVGTARHLGVEPMRKAEYDAADELGLAAISVGVMAMAGMYLAVASAQRWRARIKGGRGQAPLYRIGWKRTAMVVGVGAILPVLLYALYTRATPLGGRGEGLNWTLQRITIEYILLGLLILGLIGILSRRAVLGRMRELGLPVQSLRWRESGFGVVTMLALLIAGVLTVSAIAVALGAEGISSRVRVGSLRSISWVMMAGVWVMLGTARAASMRRKSQQLRAALTLQGAVGRSAFGPVMLAALMLALAALPLRFAERKAVERVVASEPYLATMSVGSKPAYQEMRDELRQQKAALLE
jgi:hypothetical protein